MVKHDQVNGFWHFVSLILVASEYTQIDLSYCRFLQQNFEKALGQYHSFHQYPIPCFVVVKVIHSPMNDYLT